MKFNEFVRKYMAVMVVISITMALVTGYYLPEIKSLEIIIPFLSGVFFQKIKRFLISNR